VHRRLLAAALVMIVLGGLGWAALAPAGAGSRDAVYEIPRGTSERRMAGEHVDIFPQTIRLTLGLNDVLVIHNLDDVPQTFGPTIMMPGQSFSLPFERAASYQFICTAHASGQLTIDVEPEPTTPWSRIHWRAREWWEKHKK